MTWGRNEEIAYRLAYYGGSRRLWHIIVEVIARLPEEVAEFALERCRFLSVDRGAGATWPGRVGGDASWLILLDQELPEGDAHGMVAHEVAHAWLGHDILAGSQLQDEIAAAEATRQWGFTGIGADPEHAYHQFDEEVAEEE